MILYLFWLITLSSIGLGVTQRSILRTLKFDVRKEHHTLKCEIEVNPTELLQVIQVNVTSHLLHCVKRQPLITLWESTLPVGVMLAPLRNGEPFLPSSVNNYCFWGSTTRLSSSLITPALWFEDSSSETMLYFLVYVISNQRFSSSYSHSTKVHLEFSFNNSALCFDPTTLSSPESVTVDSSLQPTLTDQVPLRHLSPAVIFNPATDLFDNNITNVSTEGGDRMPLPGCQLFQFGSTVNTLNKLLLSTVPFFPVVYRVTPTETQELSVEENALLSLQLEDDVIIKQTRLIRNSTQHIGKNHIVRLMPQGDKSFLHIAGSTQRVVVLDLVLPPLSSFWDVSHNWATETQSPDNTFTITPMLHAVLRISFPGVYSENVAAHVLWTQPTLTAETSNFLSAPILFSFISAFNNNATTTPFVLSRQLEHNFLTKERDVMNANASSTAYVNFLADYRCSIILFTRNDALPWSSPVYVSLELSGTTSRPTPPAATDTNLSRCRWCDESNSLVGFIFSVQKVLLTLLTIFILLVAALILIYAGSPKLAVEILKVAARITPFPIRPVLLSLIESIQTDLEVGRPAEEQMELGNWMLPRTPQTRTSFNHNEMHRDRCFVQRRVSSSSRSDIHHYTPPKKQRFYTTMSQDEEEKLSAYQILPESIITQNGVEKK